MVEYNEYLKKSLLEFLFAFNPICLDVLEVCKTIFKNIDSSKYFCFDVYMIYYKSERDIESVQARLCQSLFVLPKYMDDKINVEEHDMYGQFEKNIEEYFGSRMMHYDYLYTVYSSNVECLKIVKKPTHFCILSSKKACNKICFSMSLNENTHIFFTVRHILNKNNDNRTFLKIFEDIFKFFDNTVANNDPSYHEDEYAHYEGSIIVPVKVIPNIFESLNEKFEKCDIFYQQSEPIPDASFVYVYVKRFVSRHHILKIRNSLIFFLNTNKYSKDFSNVSECSTENELATNKLIKTIRHAIAWNMYRGTDTNNQQHLEWV